MSKPEPSSSEHAEGAAFSDLLREAQRGDRAAADRLYGRFGRYVLAVVRARLLPPLRRQYDSMDLSQSVFADVLRDLPDFEDRGEPAFLRWLALRSENKVRQKLRKSLGRDGSRIPRDLDLVADPTAPDAPPEVIADANETAARVAERVGDLDDETRDILRLRWEEDLSFQEIADRISASSADAVRKRYARTLARLRAGLDGA